MRERDGENIWGEGKLMIRLDGNIRAPFLPLPSLHFSRLLLPLLIPSDLEGKVHMGNTLTQAA